MLVAIVRFLQTTGVKKIDWKLFGQMKGKFMKELF
jgi:hypothetical protein